MKNWIRDWIRGWIEYLRTPEGAEIRHHGIIGGTVGGLLALFEAVRPEHFNTWAARGELFVLVALVLGVGFCFLTLVEYSLQRIKPMSIDKFGVVDGTWVYGVRDINSEEGQFDRGSIVKIKTSGLRFHVEGTAYSRQQLRTPGLIAHERPLGSFEGIGAPPKGVARIYFYFDGTEIGQSGHEQSGYGVGYYNFYEHEKLRLNGLFMGSGLGEKAGIVSNREVRGYRIATRADPEINRNKQMELLLALLEELDQDKHETRLEFDNAGIIDGWWVDAIYERRERKMELIQGSILHFTSSAISQRMWVKGYSYNTEWLAQSAAAQNREPHDFTGQGRRINRFEGFFYEFSGRQGTPEDGSGYYLFHKTPRGTTFQGAFLRRPGQAHRLVYGSKVNDEPYSKTFDVSGMIPKLEEHLDHCKRDMPEFIREASKSAEQDDQHVQAAV